MFYLLQLLLVFRFIFGFFLAFLELLLDAIDVLLADLNEEDAVDDVQVVEDRPHRRRLDLDRRERGLRLAGVDLVHLLLEDHRLGNNEHFTIK